MLSIIIAILIRIGIISNSADYNALTPAQQEQYKQQIFDDDLGNL